MKTALRAGVAAVALIAASGSAAFAQTAAAADSAAQPETPARPQSGASVTPATASDQPQTSATPEQQDNVGLQEVIVTALKRETNLQKTPIAISVLGAERLAETHTQSLLSLQDGQIPSLRVATFEARQSALTIGIRGIVPNDANQPARDQGVGVYIDGVYLGRQQGLNAALLDVDRIEVLRGPQGTLFGRNTEGGALSIVTKGPTGVFGGRVVAGFGNYGAYTGEIHQDFEEVGHVAVKVDAVVQHQDATTTNPLEGQAGWNQFDRKGFKIAGLFRPDDRFSALASFDFVHDENTPFFSQLVNFNVYGKRVRSLAEVTAGPANAPAGTINPLPALVQVRPERQDASDIGTIQQPSIDETGGVSLVLKYKLTSDLELRSITSFRAVATEQWDNAGIESRNVFSPNATFGRYSLSDLYQRQVTQEFQAVGSAFDNQVSYVAGLYYFSEHAKESAATPLTNQWNATGTDFTIRTPNGTNPNAAGTAGWVRGRRFIARASFADATSYAAYGQFTYTPAFLSERLHLTVGGRVTNDNRDGRLYVVLNRPTNFAFKQENTRFDPLVTLAYDLSPTTNLYAKYSTGFRAGGANSRSQTFAAFGPEEVEAYEIGAKTDLFDRRIRVNLALWAMDRTDTQTDFSNVDTTIGSPTIGLNTEETRNSPGVSELRGVELDVTARLMEGLTGGVSYAYTDASVPSTPFPFTGNAQIPQGSPFPTFVLYTPPNAVSAYLDYARPLGSLTLRGHFDVNYSDPQYSFQTEFADTSPTSVRFENVAVKGDANFTMNASVALADINVGGKANGVLSFWVRNLSDESFIYRISAANRGTIGDYANFNPPRTYGVELRVKY